MKEVTLINYRGSIRYETIGELIHHFKTQAPLFGMPLGTYKRILLVMIESLENIMKHSEDQELSGDGNMPRLSITLRDNQYIIESSNPVHSVHMPDLKSRIDMINNLDQQGLKKLYKETMTNGVFTKHGGAGLGLIEIAKISCSPILYDFQPINENFIRFSQRVVVDAKSTSLKENNPHAE